MAQPVFKRQDTAVGGVFSSDKAKLNFPGTAVRGTLVQGLNFNYQQNVTRLFEVGNSGAGNTTNVYYVGGRTQGTAQLNRVIGPDATIKEMYSQFGDVCNAKNNTIAMELSESDCSPGGSSQKITYTLSGVVLIQVGISVNAQDMIINEQCQLMFSGLKYE